MRDLPLTCRDRIKMDEDWYEKYLQRICNFTLPAPIQHATYTIDGISFFLIHSSSQKCLVDTAVAVRKYVFMSLAIPVDLRTPYTNQKVVLATKGRRKKVIGYVEAEPLSLGHKYTKDPEYEDDDLPCIDRNPTPVKCGIVALWVKPEFRRKKIATQLLRILKQYMMKTELKWIEIAFAHINFQSQSFACSFFNKQISIAEESEAASVLTSESESKFETGGSDTLPNAQSETEKASVPQPNAQSETEKASVPQPNAQSETDEASVVQSNPQSEEDPEVESKAETKSELASEPNSESGAATEKESKEKSEPNPEEPGTSFFSIEESMEEE